MSDSTDSLSRSLSRGVSRRSFIRTSSFAAAAAALPIRMVSGMPVHHTGGSEPLFGDAADKKALTDAALSAAKAAGAVYADVQIRWRQQEDIGLLGKSWGPPGRSDVAGFGVRSLVNGYWG